MTHFKVVGTVLVHINNVCVIILMNNCCLAGSWNLNIFAKSKAMSKKNRIIKNYVSMRGGLVTYWLENMAYIVFFPSNDTQLH